MKMNKLLSAVAGVGFALGSFGAVAGDITVGVATWNPDSSEDFSSTGVLTQWFTTTDNSSTQLVSQTDIDNAVLTPVIGNFLTGVGSYNSINDVPNTFGSICTGCELTYAFGGIKLLADNKFDITNSWMTIYSDTSADFNPTNETKFLQAQDGVEWITASFSFLTLKSGTIGGGSTEGLIDVDGGLAFDNLDTNLELGGADLFMTASAQFDLGEKFSDVGTLEITGESVIPEPTSLALLGLGLLGFGVARRRKN